MKNVSHYKPLGEVILSGLLARTGLQSDRVCGNRRTRASHAPNVTRQKGDNLAKETENFIRLSVPIVSYSV